MERFKNYGLWLAIGSFIALLLQTFGVDLDLGKYEQLWNAFLSILVIAGILNNPSIGKGFRDKP
ncbi:holin [Anoxybacillus flavithermus]|nr:holin [Anoxybacillus flavithermus]